MANHVRRQIREAIAAAITGLTTTGGRVFQSRIYPLETADLPGLLVSTLSERSAVITIHGPAVLDRVVGVEVVAVAKATADLDDALDGICKEVETALAWPVSGLAAIAKSIELRSTDITLSGNAEQPTGTARLVYDLNYFTAANAPDTAL